MIRVFSQYTSSKSIALAALESIIITLALVATARARSWHGFHDPNGYSAPEFFSQAAICMVVLQLCLYYSDFYDVRAIRRRDQQVICLSQSIGAACVVLAVVFYLFPALLIGHGMFLESMSIVACAIMISRLALDTVWRIAPVQNVAIVGTDALALRVAQEIGSRDDLNLRVSGMVASTGAPEHSRVARSEDAIPVLGGMADLESIIERHRITRIVVTGDHLGSKPVQDLIRLRVQGLRVEDVHATMTGLTGRIWLEGVHSHWFVFANGFRRSKMILMGKRVLDLLFSLTGFLICAPVMALVAVAVRLDSPGPVIYRQTRVGYKGKVFELLKFRSMRVDAESGTGAQWAQEQDPRVTRIGRIIRKYRLDELPQFVNVIRGEMSFVGPRPERPVFVDVLRREIPYYDERHMVRPGLTGWAQVQYQYGSTVAHACRKLEYDLFYLMNMSPLFDCAIVLQTIRILISGRGSR